MPKLGTLIREIKEKTTVNNQHIVLTSSQNGIVSQQDYFNKNVSSSDNTGYKIIKKGQFTYRSMSDTGYFYINLLSDYEIGIVSPAYPVFEIIDEEQLNSKYLELFFHSREFLEKSKKLSKGSTRLSFKYNQLEQIDIELKPISEQKRIVEVMENISKMIKNREKLIDEYFNLRNSKFDEMFGNPITNDKEYQMSTLGKEMTFHQGTQFPVEEQITEAKEGYSRFLRIIDYTQYPQEPRYVPDKGYHVSENDVVVVRYGATAGFIGSGLSGILANNLFSVIPNEPEQFNNKFLEHYLKSNEINKIITKASASSTMPAISHVAMKKIPLIIPPKDKQDLFVEFSNKLECQENIIKEELNELHKYYDSYMSEFFN